MTSSHTLDVGALTDVGRRRKDNQDNVLCAEDWDRDLYARLNRTYGHLYLVADGVGGNDNGEVASRMVVDHVMAYFYSDDAYPVDPVERLGAAIQRATLDIYNEARRRRNNMASTLVAALVRDNTVTIANVGDSPAFLCRNGESPRKLTVDHIRRESDGSQYLAQSMGDASVSIAFRTVDFVAGDTVVLCSDGLSDLVKPEQIKRVVSVNSARRAVRELVSLANRYGGHDNISALAIRRGKLPLLYRKQIRQAAGAGLGIVLLLVMLILGLPSLLSETPVMAGSGTQGASFSGGSISVPMLNPTTGLVEMVQATLTPTAVPSEPSIVQPVAAPSTAAPAGKTPAPTKVVRAAVTPTAPRTVSPSKTVVTPQAAVQSAPPSPTVAPRIQTTVPATARPTEARPTNTPSSIATPLQPTAPPSPVPPVSTARPTAIPTVTARPTDEPDNRAPRPTNVPTATTRPTNVPTATTRPSDVPTAVPDKPQPKPEPKPDPKPDPKVDPTPASKPTDVPKPEPTDVPKPEPTDVPKPEPTDVPKPEPTDVPKPERTTAPEPEPTNAPDGETVPAAP